MVSVSAWKRWLFIISVGLASYYLLLDIGASLFGTKAFTIICIFFLSASLGYIIWNSRLVLKEAREFFRILRQEWKLAIFAFFCAMTLASTMFFSWRYTATGLQLQAGNLHDSVWHIALIKELQQQVPPLHPSSFLNTVTNYHYYYDLGIAAVATTTGLAPTFLHYQVASILIACFLAITIVGFARSVTARRSLSYWLLFFIYFGGNAGYLIPLAFPTKTWMESSFWVSQTSSMMVNPQLLLSFALLLVIFSIPLWGDIVKNKRLFLATLVIVLSLAGIKMYAFILASALLGMYLLLRINQKTFTRIVLLMSILLIATTCMFLRFTDISKQQLIYSPLWYVNTMVEAPDRLFLIDWKLREETYLSEGAIAHYVALKAWEVLVFYGGNLGTRVLFVLLPLFLLLKWRKKTGTIQSYIFVSAGAVAGLLLSTTIPLFFIQSGVVWNTIQFWYYGLLFASILAALTLSLFPDVLPKKKISYPIICLIVIILTIPAWKQTFFARFGSDDIIPTSILATAQALKPGERVLICPTGLHTDNIFRSSLVRALSDARVYLADPVQLDLLGLDGYAREKLLVSNFRNEAWLRETVTSQQITSVICGDEDWNRQMSALLEQIGVRLFLL